jgi:tripartite-type tricarboxylate transporter receptor subunit TctC
MFNNLVNRLTVAALALGLASAPAAADAVEDFYKGKTITLIVPFNPGGTTANFAQSFADHVGKYIPGNPEVVTEFMPGGGGVVATNHAYTRSPRDGTVILIPDQALVVTQYMMPEGVQYKAGEFQWLGIALPSRAVLMVRKDTGVSSIDDLKDKEVFIGSSGAGSETDAYPRLTNALLGTKMKVIPGYPGGSTEVMVAVESGEVQGSVNGWQSWQRRPDLIPQLTPLVVYGEGREPGLPDVPNLLELVSDPEDQQIVRFYSSLGPIGRGAATLPDVPADRVAALRAAFEATLKDEDFLTRMKELNLPIVEPMTGEVAQALIEKALDTSPETIERARQLVKAE